MNTKKGFTLIESMIAISLGSAVVLGGIDIASQKFEENQENKVANDLSAIMLGIDKRLNNDNFELSDWAQYAGANYQFNNRQQVATFLSTALIATNASSCGLPTGWVPEKEDATEEAYKDSYKLVPCNTWANKIAFNLNTQARLLSESTPTGDFVTGFQIDLFYDTAADFSDSGYLHLKNIYRGAKNSNSSSETGIHDYFFINRTTGSEVDSAECIVQAENCALRAVYTGSNFSEEYLYTDGTNNMIGSKLKFQEDINGSAINTCHRYELNGVTWSKTDSVACGIGIGVEDPLNPSSGNIDYVEINTHSITTNRIFLDKECSFITPSNTTVPMPCGIYNDSGKVFAVYEEVQATTAMIGLIESSVVNTDKANVQNTLDVKGISTLRGGLTVEGDANFKGLTTIEGDQADVNLIVNTSASLKNVTVDGTLEALGQANFDSDLTVASNMDVTGQVVATSLQIKNQITSSNLGQACSENGAIVYFSSGASSDLAVCADNVWKLAHAHRGQVMAFNGSCPDGFVPFTQANGRVLVGEGSLYDSASGQTITYVTGDKGGQAKVALSVDEMPEHSHGYKDAWYSERYGPLGGGNTQGSGDTDYDNNLYERSMTTESEGDGQAHENRMPYYVINYCIYNG